MAITKRIKFDSPETETTHAGLVLEVYGRDLAAMFDVYVRATCALVWANGEPSEIIVNYNFECDRSEGRASVDASPEVVAAHAAWRVAREARLAKEAADRRQAEIDRENATPRRGRMVRVVKGRKVPKGTEGQCFWEGIGDWGRRLGTSALDCRE